MTFYKISKCFPQFSSRHQLYLLLSVRWGGGATPSSGPGPGVEPGSTAARTQPLYMRRLLGPLSWTAPDVMKWSETVVPRLSQTLFTPLRIIQEYWDILFILRHIWNFILCVSCTCFLISLTNVEKCVKHLSDIYKWSKNKTWDI